MPASRNRFPGLDGLRFLAALLVVISHVDNYRFVLGLPNHWQVPFVTRSGSLGVTLFFVLSGFLITYLLLEERAATGGIAVRRFYVRRMLRIWPLYYLLTVLGFFVLPRILPVEGLGGTEAALDAKFAMYVLLCPNLVHILWSPIPFISHLWSVGSEEQFYLLWPVAIRAARDRVLHLLVAVAAGIGLLRWGFASGALGDALGAPRLGMWAGRFLAAFSVDCMAIGGLGAYALHRERRRVLAAVFHPAAQVAVFAALAGLIAFGVTLPWLDLQTYSILFLLVILNVAANPRPLIALENPFFRFMGRISYGLYMYHPAAIVAVYALGPASLKDLGPLASDAVIYPGALVLTTLAATASYYGFERPFLRWKDRFAVIRSGEAA